MNIKIRLRTDCLLITIHCGEASMMYLVAWRTKVKSLYIDLQMVKEPQATIQMPQAATSLKLSSIQHFFYVF